MLVEFMGLLFSSTAASENPPRSWKVGVRLGVAVIQQQLLYSSIGEVVSSNCRYSV
ncbi:hypothetical protein HAX54_052691, partial [Datura stramonium]|nr:hypothetical protein [Datura stramonium]